VTFRQSVKVENDVIPFNQRIQQRYQVQQGLVQIDFGKVEPFADENDDRSAELVNSALIEASDSGHFAQVLRLGAAQ